VIGTPKGLALGETAGKNAALLIFLVASALAFRQRYSFRCLRRSASIEKSGKLSRRQLVRTDAADMLKRRLKQAGLPAHYSPHSFRATGITNFLENDGTLEAAQRIAGHADSRTTKLYDRRGQKVLLEAMERIRY
jgi:site-specific recombinase XerD